MAGGETLEELGRSRATLAIHLSVRNLAYVERALTPYYGKDCPVVVLYRVTWPDQKIIHGTLATIAAKVRAEKLTRTALILIGQVLAEADFRNSALYDSDHEHVLRNRKTAQRRNFNPRFQQPMRLIVHGRDARATSKRSRRRARRLLRFFCGPGPFWRAARGFTLC